MSTVARSLHSLAEGVLFQPSLISDYIFLNGLLAIQTCKSASAVFSSLDQEYSTQNSLIAFGPEM